MKLLKKINGIIIRYIEFFIFSRNFVATDKATLHPKSMYRGIRVNGNVVIEKGCKIIGGVSLKTNSLIYIKRYTSINGPNTDLFSQINAIKIGAFCSIARNVSFQEFNHNYKGVTSYPILQNIFNYPKKTDIYSSGDIIIGNDVWIGTQCVILSGSEVGNGVIIAANSVINGKIPAYAIVGGTPAKILKFRHSIEIIEALESIKWWNWSIEKIKKNKFFFEGELTLAKIKSIE